MSYINEILNIKTKNDLIDFISSLIIKINNEYDEMENTTVGLYIDALCAWLCSFESLYKNMNWKIPKQISWNAIGQVLLDNRYFGLPRYKLKKKKDIIDFFSKSKNKSSIANTYSTSEVADYFKCMINVLNSNKMQEENSSYGLIAQALDAALYYE